MRLLNSRTLVLHEFMENQIPPYAILSHTWETDEVSFQDMLNRDSSISQKKGYSKIYHCCRTALADGFEYAWIDTCCIDKTSSAELSEAINSMYQWYKKAEVCYAYIADYTAESNESIPGEDFARSRWFTRGWTLQELIAPTHVLFFDRNWKEIGTKISLCESIESITGIHVDALLNRNLEVYTVAQRMSWASKRQTTRTEDIAYSLMGIFDVNMPMLYGEGKGAFVRLQQAIMLQSIDHTLFAWHEGQGTDQTGTGLLAESPRHFDGLNSIVRRTSKTRQPFSVTNSGVQFEIPLILDPSTSDAIAVLDCQDSQFNNTLIGLRLKADFWIENTFSISARYRQVQVPISEVDKHPVRKIYIDLLGPARELSRNEYGKVLVDVENIMKLNIKGTSEDFEGGGSKMLTLRVPAPSVHFPTAALLFSNPWEMNGHGCIILFRTTYYDWPAMKIAVVEVKPEKLLSFISSSRKLTTSEFVDDVESLDFVSDRILWQHPIEQWRLRIGMKRRIIDGEKIVHALIEDLDRA